MRAAFYARVSTERQERRQTIGSQLANLHRRADTEGRVLAEAYGYGLRCPRLKMQTTVAAIQMAAVQKNSDVEGTVVITNTPAELGTFMQQESQRWAAVIEKAGLTTD